MHTWEMNEAECLAMSLYQDLLETGWTHADALHALELVYPECHEFRAWLAR